MNFLLPLLLFVVACTPQSQKEPVGPSPKTQLLSIEAEPINTHRVYFSYVIDSSSDMANDQMVMLKCKLRNDNRDTLYFFTHSCFGWEHTLEVDTSHFQVLSRVNCIVSNPIVKKVAPESELTFNGLLSLKEHTDETPRVRYYLYPVERGFDPMDGDKVKGLQKVFLTTVPYEE